jgi:hypothetical protein
MRPAADAAFGHTVPIVGVAQLARRLVGSYYLFESLMIPVMREKLCSSIRKGSQRLSHLSQERS